MFELLSKTRELNDLSDEELNSYAFRLDCWLQDSLIFHDPDRPQLTPEQEKELAWLNEADDDLQVVVRIVAVRKAEAMLSRFKAIRKDHEQDAAIESALQNMLCKSNGDLAEVRPDLVDLRDDEFLTALMTMR